MENKKTKLQNIYLQNMAELRLKSAFINFRNLFWLIIWCFLLVLKKYGGFRTHPKSKNWRLICQKVEIILGYQRSYSSDLRPQEFALIEKFLPKKKITKPRKYSNYQLFNTILYVLISGCQHFIFPKLSERSDDFTC